MSKQHPERRRRVLSAASPTSCSDPKALVTREGPPRAAGRPVRGHPRPALSISDEGARNTIRTELETNLLVEAGAGSGKTQMLAERMASGVAKGVYQVEHLAAVTFTRKAASELRGRFHHALETLAASLAARGFPPATTADAETRRSGVVAARGFSPATTAGTSPLESDYARIQHALGNLERFFAGTIHSFCARLLRERPVESGVSPGFTELDEVQDEELRNRAWRDFITNMRAAGDHEMLELLATGVRPQDLESAFAIICGNEDVEFPPGDGACPDPKAAWKALEKFWKKLEALLPARLEDATTCEIQKAARQYRAQLRVARKRLDRPSVMADLLDTWDCKSSIVQKWWDGTSAETKRLKADIELLHGDFCADIVTPYLSQWRQYVYRLSVSVLACARDHARQERHRQNSLNYGDLLNLSAKVLRENAAVRRALQQKYRHLFVDEFQDTDPIQAEIVFLLAADENGSTSAGCAGSSDPAALAANGVTDSTRSSQLSRSRSPITDHRSRLDPPFADWRTIPVRSGALFVVGDPKQSIYRFRRADIEIYNAVRRRFEDPAVGKVVELTRNWRSVPALCEWANDVFAAHFPAEPSVHSPRFAPLVPKDPDSSRAGLPATSAHSGPPEPWRRREPCPSGLFTISHAGESKAAAAADAEAIARYIRTEVDAGRRRFSDFLILTRKKKARIAPYAQALEALNVPIEVSGAGAFGESAEVAALTVLLRTLADPQDQLTLVNVLRGPLFGLSDPQLYAFKEAGGWFSIFFGADATGEVSKPEERVLSAASPTSCSDPRALATGEGPPRAAGRPVRGHPREVLKPEALPVANALETLRQYHRWTRILPAGAALDRILERSGYLALAATTPGGVEAGDLVHAVDRVRQVVESGGNLADAADALEADTEASNEVESLPLEPGRSDVVRLMNLHKAKGLEATVVFLADPCGGVGKWVDVHIERDGTKALGWFKVEKKSQASFASKLLGEHADWEQHKQAEEPYLAAEENRLLYVASTRAREMLVVSRFSGSGRNNPAWGVLNEALDAAQELPIPTTATVSIPKPDTCSTKVQADAVAALSQAEASVNVPSWSITSVTAESKHIATMAGATETAAPDDATRVVAQDTPSHRADAGMAWGTLIHGLLEHAMRHQGATREDLRRLAMWLTVEEPQLRDVIEQAIDTVESAAKAEFWAEAQRHSRSAEAPFAVAESARLTNGVIDLLYEGEVGWQLVDYKTDRSLEDSRYAAQLENYRAALLAVGCQVAGAAVVNVRTEPA